MLELNLSIAYTRLLSKHRALFKNVLTITYYRVVTLADKPEFGEYEELISDDTYDSKDNTPIAMVVNITEQQLDEILRVSANVPAVIISKLYHMAITQYTAQVDSEKKDFIKSTLIGLGDKEEE